MSPPLHRSIGRVIPRLILVKFYSGLWNDWCKWVHAARVVGTVLPKNLLSYGLLLVQAVSDWITLIKGLMAGLDINLLMRRQGCRQLSTVLATQKEDFGRTWPVATYSTSSSGGPLCVGVPALLMQDIVENQGVNS